MAWKCSSRKMRNFDRFHWINERWSLRKVLLWAAIEKSPANCITVAIVNCTCFWLSVGCRALFVFFDFFNRKTANFPFLWLVGWLARWRLFEFRNRIRDTHSRGCDCAIVIAIAVALVCVSFYFLRVHFLLFVSRPLRESDGGSILNRKTYY